MNSAVAPSLSSYPSHPSRLAANPISQAKSSSPRYENRFCMGKLCRGDVFRGNTSHLGSSKNLFRVINKELSGGSPTSRAIGLPSGNYLLALASLLAILHSSVRGVYPSLSEDCPVLRRWRPFFGRSSGFVPNPLSEDIQY